MCLVGPLLALGAREGLVPLNRVDTAGIHWTRAGRHFDVGHGKEFPNIATSSFATAAVSGACIYVPAAAHSRIRGSTHEFFDECFLANREDAELGIRARLLGVEPVIEPRARGLHFRGNPGTARGNTLIDLLSVQNRFLLRWEYLFKGPCSPLMAGSRDLVVVVAVLLRERTSIDGIVGAWRIRRRMRWKGRRLRFAADLKEPRVRQSRTLGLAVLLNIGKGPGLFESTLGQLGYNVQSVDIDPATQPDLVGDIGSLTDLIGTKQYSIVTAFQVLEHLPKNDLANAIAQLAAARTTGGSVVISVPQYGALVTGEIKIAGLPRVAFGRAYKRSRAPFRATDHVWELGHAQMPLREFGAVLRAEFTRVESWVPARNPYHRFYACS